MQESQATESANINAEISDEKFDKYFESEGKEGIEEAPSKEQESVEETQKQGEEKEESATDVNKLMKEVENYKGMGHEERKRRKEVERELQETNYKLNRMNEILQNVQAAQQQQQNEPDFDSNPLEALRIKQERLEQMQYQQYKTEEHRQQEFQQQQQLQAFRSKYQIDLESFYRENPDFKEACDHLRSHKIKEYQHAGYSPEQIQRLITEDELSVASKSYQDGVNPAERLYKWAQHLGYQNNQKNKTQQNSVESKIKTIEKGIQASRSLSNTPGKSIKNELSVEALLSMDDDEFKQITDAQWDKFVKSNR
jgi:hypothetical protein